MKKILALLCFCAALAVVAPAAHAAGTACYNWSCDFAGTCSINASCSTASPYVWKYEILWGDGATTGLTGTVSHSHTYAAGTYDAFPVVRIHFFSAPYQDDASCVYWPYRYPLGPQPPSIGSCS